MSLVNIAQVTVQGKIGGSVGSLGNVVLGRVMLGIIGGMGGIGGRVGSLGTISPCSWSTAYYYGIDNA